MNSYFLVAGTQYHTPITYGGKAAFDSHYTEASAHSQLAPNHDTIIAEEQQLLAGLAGSREISRGRREHTSCQDAPVSNLTSSKQTSTSSVTFSSKPVSAAI